MEKWNIELIHWQDTYMFMKAFTAILYLGM